MKSKTPLQKAIIQIEAEIAETFKKLKGASVTEHTVLVIQNHTRNEQIDLLKSLLPYEREVIENGVKEALRGYSANDRFINQSASVYFTNTFEL